MAPPEINGKPETMGSYDTTRNLKEFNPKTDIKSGMDEGVAFAAKDKEAEGILTEFIQLMGHELRSATVTARANKLSYIGADKDAATQLQAIAFQNVPVDVPAEKP
jgi:hypothetical protein